MNIIIQPLWLNTQSQIDRLPLPKGAQLLQVGHVFPGAELYSAEIAQQLAVVVGRKNVARLKSANDVEVRSLPNLEEADPFAPAALYRAKASNLLVPAKSERHAPHICVRKKTESGMRYAVLTVLKR